MPFMGVCTYQNDDGDNYNYDDDIILVDLRNHEAVNSEVLEKTQWEIWSETANMKSIDKFIELAGCWRK